MKPGWNMLMESHGIALYLPVSGTAGSLGGTSASLEGCPASSAQVQNGGAQGALGKQKGNTVRIHMKPSDTIRTYQNH